MSNGLKTPASNVVRIRLQVLRDFHTPVLRAGEERLRAAMADYAAVLSSLKIDRESSDAAAAGRLTGSSVTWTFYSA